MRTNAWDRVAGVLVGLEAAALFVLVARQVMALLTGDTESLESAIALVVLSVVGTVAVAAFAAAIWRGRSWGRSGGIVTQLLILAVAGGAATGAYAEPVVALAIAAPAVVTLVLLILGVRAAGREPAAGE
ncbi:histidine kinase [Microbacterium terricola]|uniref:Histidine kinase n=1 Tax=Microbacterium terricola TaxID=344163 RepID=A0ABM8DWP2_9MICO|nr:histidine kinase [Microbacterium terricola]UYK39193.1 histidine kinase [Microbacterium terricola]BDV30088.1 hypothetical protein Microterr_07480 [Microbacterium terricola]